MPLTTSDGHTLDADIDLPETGCVGGVVVCHPHPQYGGDRFNPVVDAVFRRLPAAGFAALRFDFRAEFGGGTAERLDVVAAVDELQRRVDGRLFVVGYSFGAAVALATGDPRIRGIVAVAPPLAVMPVEAPSVPTLVLVPRHDQFTPPDAAREAVEGWPNVDLRTIESVDHFLVGRSGDVAESVADWLATQR